MTGLSRLLTTPAPDARARAPVAPAAPRCARRTRAVPRIKATLYFASEDGLRLVPVESEVALAEGVVAQARSIIEAQLAAAGAGAAGLDHSRRARRCAASSCRSATKCSSISTPSIRTAHPGGTLQELMTVYTIVNALLTNLPNLQDVQILIGGQEVDTLGGSCGLAAAAQKNDGLILSSDPTAPRVNEPPERSLARPAPSHHHHAGLHDSRRRLGADRGRAHARHLHGEHRRQSAALSAQHRQGLGDGRIRHAAARDLDAIGARSRGRQGRRPDDGDPAADRPIDAVGGRRSNSSASAPSGSTAT